MQRQWRILARAFVLLFTRQLKERRLRDVENQVCEDGSRSPTFITNTCRHCADWTRVNRCVSEMSPPRKLLLNRSAGTGSSVKDRTTPLCLLTTRQGTVPHLTQETLSQLEPSLIHGAGFLVPFQSVGPSVDVIEKYGKGDFVRGFYIYWKFKMMFWLRFKVSPLSMVSPPYLEAPAVPWSWWRLWTLARRTAQGITPTRKYLFGTTETGLKWDPMNIWTPYVFPSLFTAYIILAFH